MITHIIKVLNKKQPKIPHIPLYKLCAIEDRTLFWREEEQWREANWEMVTLDKEKSDSLSWLITIVAIISQNEKFPFPPCIKFILTHFLWLSYGLFKHMFLVFYRHTWQVQDKIDANNVAYTTGKLSFHTDYPALHHPPGVR